MNLPNALIRHLKRARETLSEMMADEAYGVMVREVAAHCGMSMDATGGMVIRTRHGGTLGYYAEFSCHELNAMLAFAGALKVQTKRPEAGPVRSCPWE